MGIHHSHSHNHDDSHKHGEVKSFNKAFAIAVIITLTYSLSEVVYGFIANSLSLLADAVHNLGDVLGLVLAWIANWLLTLPARQRYSYGFKKRRLLPHYLMHLFSSQLPH